MLNAVMSGFRLALLAAALGFAPVWAQPAPATGAADVLATGPAGAVTRDAVELAVKELVPFEEQPNFWRMRDPVERLVRSLAAVRALAAEAEKAGITPPAETPAAPGPQRDRALMEAYMAQRVKAVMPDAAAIERYARSAYNAESERFAIPEEVRVRHILLPVAKDGSDDAAVKTKAESLLAQLRQGGDFAALAQELSADPGSARRGGELAWFARGRMVPPFEEAAFKLKSKGELSEPVKTPFGYHVIELLEHRPAGKLTFEQALPELRKEAVTRIDGVERRRLWESAEASVQLNEAAVRSLMDSHDNVAKPGAAKP